MSISYFLIVFIDIIDDSEMRYEIGWYMIFVSLLNIAVNWINLVVTIIIAIAKKLCEIINKKRLQKTKYSSREKFKAIILIKISIYYF